MSTSEETTVTASEGNVTCVNLWITLIAPGDCDFFSTASLVFVVLSIILIVWGLFNNIILLVIILTNGRQMKTIPNIFIANMAFLGILFLVIVSGGNLFLFGQIAFQVRIVRSSSVPSTLFFFQIFVSTASFTTLVMLGLDRYLAIVHPLRSRPHRTKKRAMIANGFVWIIAGLCMIPLFLEGGSRRDIFLVHTDPGARKAMMTFMLFAYILPVILFLVMYLAILKVIWLTPTTMQLQGEDQARRWKQRIQVFKSISRIVLTFALHYGYSFAIFLWIINGGHSQVSPRVSNVLFYSSLLIIYLNTCINPLIYALGQKSFRPFVYKLLCPKACRLRKPHNDALNTTQQNYNTKVAMAPRIPPNKQEDGVRSSSIGRGPPETNLNGNIDKNGILSNGKVNEGYHVLERTGDENTSKNDHTGVTVGDVIVIPLEGPKHQTCLQHEHLNETEECV